MSDNLKFPIDHYQIKTLTLGGETLTYRAFENLQYCAHPLDPIQTLNLFVPESYYHHEGDQLYAKDAVPIFMPNTVGGYLPGPATEPGVDAHSQQINSLFRALVHGYVVVSVGVRGRTSGKISNEFFEGSAGNQGVVASGHMVGRAPACIVDYKAAIRYLRHNRDLIPGNVDRIITSGTSAGGALSALAGASGNSPLYQAYLNEIGAVDERDDIFAANCYCPIHNLEHADAAYEWQFNGFNDYYRTKHQKTDDGFIRVPDIGTMSAEQIAVSNDLKKLFPEYLNRLNLHDAQGNQLILDAEGEGSFKDYVKQAVIDSANAELTTHDNQRQRQTLMTPGSAIDEQDYFVRANGWIVDFDWQAYVAKITRMKAAPAFDALDLSCPENEEFGDQQVSARHFTTYSQVHSTVSGAELAQDKLIKLMNPTRLLDDSDVMIAKHWRIRHGAFDRDTSLAIPIILQTMLTNRGYDVDFALPWGLPHSGDYDLDELFTWIDDLCLDRKDL